MFNIGNRLKCLPYSVAMAKIREMIDWVKMLVNTPKGVNTLLQSPSLDFTQELSISTGEVIEYPKRAKNNGFEFVVQSANRGVVTGSLHKYWNEGVNHNDFKFTDLTNAIHSFCNKYQLEPSMLLLQNLEFGVNIKPETNATQIIRDIICFKNRQAIQPYNDEKGCFVEYNMTDYYFKVYDKGKQYKLQDNILRIEVKAMKSRVFTCSGIRTVKDLLYKENIALLADKFTSVYKHLVFDDEVNVKHLSKADRGVYEILRNPKVWEKRRGAKNGTHRARERRFKGIVRKRGKYGHYEAVDALIIAKWQELINS